MVAIYPAAVKKFSPRQDYTELVEAADVNVAYEEIAAIQTTLGVNPNTDTIDGKVKSWPTVSNRITAVRQGVSNPYIHAAAHNQIVPYGGITAVWTDAVWDTHKMMGTGGQLICPRTGVYTFDIYIRWHADDLPNDNQQPIFNRNGQLNISISAVNTNYNIVAQGGFFPIGWQKSTHQSASMTAPWSAGQAVTMMLQQTCLTTPITATAVCAITYHRDPPTQNNL